MSTEEARRAAVGLIRRGVVPIPVPAGKKNPGRRGWEALRITEEEVPDYWTNGQNVGVLCGEPSGWLVDVDLDSREAVAIADQLLPPTLASGREARPRSHRWYRVEGARSRDWKAPDGEKLVELRSTGRQTLVAPSTHPDGGCYLWHREEGNEAAEISPGELTAVLNSLATAALISRHVPPVGGRHDFALALAGFLLRPGRMGAVRALKILDSAWRAAGADPPEALRDLEGIVRDTAARISRGEPVVGGPNVEEVAPGVVKPIMKWWGWSREEPATGEERPYGVLLSEVRPERVRWLWERRIARGKVNLVDGDPGTGKSAMTTDLAARVTSGKAWPDGAGCEAGGVVILSAEDGLADTIRPRFDAGGGVPAKAVALSTVPDAEGNERQLAIPHDLAVLEAAIERVGAVLAVVDPLMAFLPGDVNSHRDQDVRRALAPLARLAEKTGTAVVVVRHLNKAAGGNVLYRGGGSIGIVGAARSGLLVAKHPDDDGRRVLASIKSNLARPAPSLVFALSSAENGAVRVDWGGESTLDASSLLFAPADPEERSALEEAKDFIRDILADGPIPAKDAEAEGRQAGIEPRTLKRAKQKLGIVSERQGGIGGQGSWYWRLPDGFRASKGTKGTKPNDGPLSSAAGCADGENTAYSSQKRGSALRGPSVDDAKRACGRGPLSGPLPVDAIGAETRRANSGPAKALATYLEKPNEERLEWLTKAVLRSRGIDAADWRQHAGAVEETASDPVNHPLDCECLACV